MNGSGSRRTDESHQAERAARPGIAIDARATVNEGDRLATGWLSTDGGDIVDADGNVVRLTGVNWFGGETTRMAPDGLFTRNWRDMMDQMDDLGFNVIRLPFSNDALRDGAMPTGIDPGLNPGLAGIAPIRVIDKVVKYAEELGMRVILDNHRRTAGDGAEGGLWYGEGGYSEADWIADWTFLAERYKDNPTVVGFDLANEPHAASWGTGDAARDWRLGAERAIEAIHAVNPNVLAIVEGIGGDTWWGGNLRNARDFPVRLEHSDKLVYSPHDYPPSLYPQPWFSDPNFPNNLPDVWDRTWGYLAKEDIAPVLVGEFGTKLQDARDIAWLEKLVPYMADNGMSWTFWSWNPNSGDTGGILQDDWRTVWQEKMARLIPALGGELPDATTTEETRIRIAVRLDEASDRDVAVHWTTRDGTAANGVDYEGGRGRLLFEAGQTRKAIWIDVLGDNRREGDETFRLILRDAAGGDIERRQTVVTIRDDDGRTARAAAPRDADAAPRAEHDADADGHAARFGDDDWSHLRAAPDVGDTLFA